MTNGGNSERSTKGFRYRFDEFEIDPANRELLRSGQVVALRGKVFDVLLALATHPGRLLAKQEIIEQVWQNEFVEEGNLARSVSTLRKALDDTAAEHKYIATVPGHGYRFVGDIRSYQPSNGSAAGSTYGSERPTFKRRISNVWHDRPILAAMTVISLFSLAALTTSIGPTRGKAFENVLLRNIHQSKLTQDGNVYAPAISRDGQYLAYVGLFGEQQAICVRQIITGSVLQLVPPSPNSHRWGPTVAPDNGFVYYLSRDADSKDGSLFRVPLFGGQPKKVVDLVASYAVSPDSKRLAIIRRSLSDQTMSIIVENIDGSEERYLRSFDIETSINSIDWSPDNDGLIFSAIMPPGSSKTYTVAELSLDGKVETPVNKPGDLRLFNIRWLKDKTGFIVAASEAPGERPQLFYLSYPGGRVRRLTNDVDGHASFTMTADAGSIVTERSDDDRRIEVISARDRRISVIAANNSDRHFDRIDWSTGDYLVFDEDADGSYSKRNIVRMRPDGSDRANLTEDVGDNIQPAASPDGRTIVFVSSRSGKFELWRTDIGGGSPTQLTDLPFDVYDPSYSADGRSVYFSAWKEAGWRVWEIGIDGSGAKQVIDADVRDWALAPDGKRIVYSYLDSATNANRTLIRSLGTNGSEIELGLDVEMLIGWSHDGRSIYFIRSGDEQRNVWQFDLSRSSQKQAAEFVGDGLRSLSWSPDGSRAAVVRQDIRYDAVLIQAY